MAKDTQTELQVIVLAKRMMKHSIAMANNQNRFPKKYRFSMEKFDEFYTSWGSYAAGGDTYHLLQKMDAIYNILFNQTETGGETNVLY